MSVCEHTAQKRNILQSFIFILMNNLLFLLIQLCYQSSVFPNNHFRIEIPWWIVLVKNKKYRPFIFRV